MKINKIREMSNISLWLDSYGDIFSDFDSRLYKERALSVDFLDEAKRASRDKVCGNLQLRLLLKKSKRRISDERVIVSRLRHHFRKHKGEIANQIKKVKIMGLKFVIAGILLMIAATYLLFTYQQKSLLVSFLVVFLEPAGWFLFWEGLNQLIFETKKINPDHEFYTKMANCDIKFLSC